MTYANEITTDLTIDNEVTAVAALTEKLADALTPGYQAEFDPDEAEQAGAFEEDALSEQDAAESDVDLVDATVPVFIEDGQHLDIPANVTTANARNLFGKRPGESVKDALARIETVPIGSHFLICYN
jgi:hypothetical protein